MSMKSRIVFFLLALILATLIPCQGAAKSDPAQSTPPELYQWKDWVLHDNVEALCPTRYNNEDAWICTWPTELKLDIGKTGGAFRQQWIVFSEQMVSLPGSGAVWPVDVRVDGEPAPVVSRDGLPAILLPEGTHTIAGKFKWPEAPLMLPVPPAVGLVDLTLFGQRVDSPRIDESGRLWLQTIKTEEEKEDRCETAVFRLINDTIPIQITTRLLLKVSGSVREISFPGILFSGHVPTAIQSSLPVRVGAGGEVILQARPGTWDVRITCRSRGPVSELVLENPLAETEIWSFQAQNQLRMVKVEGAPSIDPSRTDLPAEWQGYPAYLLGEGEKLVFKEIRRGDPDPSPDRLTLNRTLWLDFDGKGFTIRDLVAGTMSRNWFIALNPPARLGRVSVDGQDMLITKQGPEEKPGIQLRKGRLNLEADLRVTDADARMSAVNWDHDFQEVSGTLNLPPGWRLFSAGGVDSLPGAWLQDWTLMDIFIVLIISVALFKLRGWRWGLAALVTLCLIYNEAGAPRAVWLCIIAAMALSKVLPEGRFKRLANISWVAAVIVLLAISIPFMVQQLRWGIFPQLEPVGYLQARVGETLYMQAFEMKSDQLETNAAGSLSEGGYEEQSKRLYRTLSPQKVMKATEVYDPDALVQTGPGVPDWRWRSYAFSWNGPVKSDQEMTFRLIAPVGNLVLSVLRVLMLALLVVCVINIRGLREFARRKAIGEGVAGVMILCLVSSPAVSRAADASAVFPPQELLQELEDRLLEAHECYPNCADIPFLDIDADPDSLALLLEVDAVIDTAVPLPVTATSWQPKTILLDGEPIEGLSRESGGALWALIPQGVHRLELSGDTRSLGDIQLPFALKPHFASFESDGWEVVGIGADGSVGASIRLTRSGDAGEELSRETFETSRIPAFLEIERMLHLGITWSVTTEFRYRADTQASVVISFPLLSGEAVTTSGVTVADGSAVISMAPNRPFTMTSTLGIAPEIRLSAPEDVPWTETWVLDASPIWSCGLSGIPPVHHQDDAGQWRPTWMPWPGEAVVIAVSRPEAIPGQSITIDAAELSYTPGQRYHQAGLSLSIRTSRGGQHRVELPPDATLQQLTVDGKSLPVEQDGRRISFPLQPGANRVSIEWQQAASSGVLLKSPEIKIGEQAVNANVVFNVPRSRWTLLTGGPRLGPAVLFWSYLLVVALAAFGLKYVRVTPLKFRHWLLLGIGLTQVPVAMAILVVGWLIALGFRQHHYSKEKWFSFNLIQVGLFFLTLLALGCLYKAVEQGLLGTPDMQIAGNGSSRYLLRWTQDRIDAFMPTPWTLAVPIWTYHVLMLLWSLWLSFSLIKWLQWGWKCYGSGGSWRRRKRAVKENGG